MENAPIIHLLLKAVKHLIQLPTNALSVGTILIHWEKIICLRFANSISLTFGASAMI